MDILVIIAVTFGGWSMGKINTMDDILIRQQIQIKANQDALASLGHKIDRLTTAIESMVFEQEVQNRLAKYQMRDRWTAGMQEELQNEWFNMLSEIHPELKHQHLPTIRDIQARYPEGNLTAP
jgi:hypothetical protein